MALEPPQSVVLAPSSSHNEGSLVSLPLHWAEEINADVHPYPGPVAPSFQDDVRSPGFPSHRSHIQDQFRLPSTNPEKESRSRFNPDPVEEVPFIPSPASSTFSLPPSPGPSTPPPSTPRSRQRTPRPSCLISPCWIPASTPRHQSRKHMPASIPHRHLWPLACTFTPHSSRPTSNTTCVPYPPSPVHTPRQSFLPRLPLSHACPIWIFVRVISPGYSTLPPTLASRLGGPTSQFRTSCSQFTTTSARM